MAVNKKGLRKVKARGKQYFWRVSDVVTNVPDEGFVQSPISRRQLHIISTDKKFIVHYNIPQIGDAQALLYVEGPLFPRAPGQREVAVPRWRHDSKRFPTVDFVRRLIDWSMETESDG